MCFHPHTFQTWSYNDHSGYVLYCFCSRGAVVCITVINMCVLFRISPWVTDNSQYFTYLGLFELISDTYLTVVLLLCVKI